LWCAFDIYHAIQWIRLHGGIADNQDSQVFRQAIDISYLYGPDFPAGFPKVPISVIILHIVLRMLFWAGSSIVFALYSSKLERVADGYRLVGFLFFGTLSVDVTATFLASGQTHLFLVSLFGSVWATLGTSIALLVVVFLLFPRKNN
jgi:hypothetical protein